MWNTIRSFFKTIAIGDTLELEAVPSGTQPSLTLPVVALIAGGRDRELLSGLAHSKQWDFRFSDSCGEAWALAKESGAPVILCDRDLPATEWRDLVQILASAPQHPSVILTSRVVDEYLWQEVIRNGGYDVLAKPLREDDVVRSVRLAWSYWKSAARMSALPLRHYR